MAFSSAALSAEPRAWSLGPWRVELQSISAQNTDTSGDVTAETLDQVIAAIPGGLNVEDVSISGKVVSLTFLDPGEDAAGYILLIGR